jgi:hypothetical protein
VKDDLKEPWFQGQNELLRAMGQTWADLGRLKVVHVGEKVSTAEVKASCDYIQRGDIILPFTERPAPQLKPDSAVVDPFAPPNGKTGMIVSSKYFGLPSRIPQSRTRHLDDLPDQGNGVHALWIRQHAREV